MGQGRNKRRRIIGKAKLRSKMLQGCDVVLTTLSESKPFIYSSLEKLTLLHFLLFLTISSKYYFISPGGAGSKAFSKHKQGSLLFLAHHSPDINLHSCFPLLVDAIYRGSTPKNAEFDHGQSLIISRVVTTTSQSNCIYIVLQSLSTRPAKLLRLNA